MIISKEICLKYNFYLPYYEKIKEILDQTLINYSSKNNYAYSSRIKKLDSLAEKIESGRYKNWASLDDFIGAVIIVPNINCEPSILKYLDTIFVQVGLKKRSTNLKSPDVFRFDSTRYIAKLMPINTPSIINSINFEIQICSAFEHAWSVTTHDLAYKSKTVDWKALRLAAQLKSSVEQLDMIIMGARSIKDNIQECKWSETAVKTSICVFFENLFSNKIIPIELTPKDMSRFADNLFTILRDSIKNADPKKSSRDIKNIIKILEHHFTHFNEIGYPMSLSLYQLCFGIFMKENILNERIYSEHPFHRSDLFFTIFPECKERKLKEFIL